MDPDHVGHYEAVPLQCFACAARDAEARQASAAKSGGLVGSGGLDGLYFAVTERGG
jgi:hypothetical protein